MQQINTFREDNVIILEHMIKWVDMILQAKKLEGRNVTGYNLVIYKFNMKKNVYQNEDRLTRYEKENIESEKQMSKHCLEIE